MFVLSNVRPIKSAKNASVEQRLESEHMTKVRRAYSELTLKQGAKPSLEQLSKKMNEPTENLQKILAFKPKLTEVNNKLLESQYLCERVA